MFELFFKHHKKEEIDEEKEMILQLMNEVDEKLEVCDQIRRDVYDYEFFDMDVDFDE